MAMEIEGMVAIMRIKDSPPAFSVDRNTPCVVLDIFRFPFNVSIYYLVKRFKDCS